MKSAINFYYNLFPEDIIKQDRFCYFWVEDEKFYFVPFNNDKDQVLKIYKILLENNLKINQIILNKENDLVTIYKNEKYALFRVNCIENEIVDFNNFFNLILNESAVNWGVVWSEKIDYFIYQVSQRGLGKDNILNSFSYYVGLGENAIQYYNLIDKKNAVVGIQHKRVYSINYEINYKNPLNMIVDYNIRDLAEYIKFAFFQDNLNIDKIINYINSLNLNECMMNLLFVRLLFPTYYFDHYERVVNDEEGEKELINIINKANSYETFLNNFYKYYNSKYHLIRIEWLTKSTY